MLVRQQQRQDWLKAIHSVDTRQANVQILGVSLESLWIP